MGMSDILFDIEVTTTKLTAKNGNEYYKLQFNRPHNPDKANGIANILMFINGDAITIAPQKYQLFHPYKKGGKGGKHQERDETKKLTAYTRWPQKVKIKRAKKNNVVQFYVMNYKKKKRYPITFNHTKHIGDQHYCPYRTISHLLHSYTDELFYNEINPYLDRRDVAYKLLLKRVFDVLKLKFEVEDGKLK